MIQDIFPMHLSNEYHKKVPQADSFLMIFKDNRILAKNDGQVCYLTYKELSEICRWMGKEIPVCVYLFSIGEDDYFLTDPGEEIEVPGFVYYKMFETRTMQPKERVLAAATAWHLYVWYRDNVYCGRCGHKLVHSEKLRMLSCPDCNNMVFPKIAPAVIVGVTNGRKILMTKYANREYKRYALIAGFTEIGETAEETVAREVKEEVGLSVKNIRYYKSQPWGFDSNLLLGYFCELDDEGDAMRLDEEELACAEWVDFEDVPDDPEGLSLTREMMLCFRDIMNASESTCLHD